MSRDANLVTSQWVVREQNWAKMGSFGTKSVVFAHDIIFKSQAIFLLQETLISTKNNKNFCMHNKTIEQYHLTDRKKS